MSQETIWFATDDEFVAFLKTINSDGAEAPKNVNYTAVTREAKDLYQRFRSELGEEIEFDGDGSIQDASFHSAILVPPRSQLRLSNFKYLATITSEENISLKHSPVWWKSLRSSAICTFRFDSSESRFSSGNALKATCSTSFLITCDLRSTTACAE